MRYMIVGLAMLGLVGCATDPGVSAKVYAAMESLTLAETAYVKTCKDVPTLTICVDPTKQTIKDLDNKAYAAVELATQNSAMLSFAILAISDFVSATAKR